MENNNITPKSIIKSWFEQGLKPLAAQFHAWMDAYWHKNEKIPLGTVEHLEETLNKKAESSTLEDMSGKFEGHVSDNTLHKTENEQNKLSYLADNPNSTYATKESLNDLADNVYRKSETYNRTEVNERNSVTLQTAMEYADNQVSGLGNQVYRKTETYNRGEVDSKDTATLEAAKKYVVDRIAEIVGSSPDALDTLYEIAAALGNDPDFATTIMTLINNKADKVHTHTRSQITDFPTSLPASDVYAWAKAPTKPSYTALEVGAATASHKHAATDVTEDSAHRFMTDAERTKLDGIETGANKYVHPASHSADMITDSTTKVMMTKGERSKLNYLADNPNSTYATKESLNDLGADVYRKSETYNRGEVDSKDTATLEAAKKYVVDRIAEIVGSSPDALDTLYEIAAALGNDPNFATTIMTLINNKADKVHTHTRSQITDFPTSLPASDVYPWAKASAKPTYNFDEITNSPNKAYTGVLRRVIASGYELGYGYGSKAGFGLYQNHESFDSLMLSAWKTDDGSTEEDHWFNWYFDPIGQRITDDNGKTLAFTSEIPTSLPASDVYPWAKASTKPSYTPSEVGAAATSHKHAATDVTEDSTHRFMTDEERTKLKNLNNSGFEIKEIDNFNDASTSGIYAVRGNAFGGPKYNDPSFAYRGCLKVFSQSSGSPSIPSLFTLMEFTVKDNNGNTFYFIRFYGEINNTNEDWVQVVPTSPSTSVPSPSPTD